MIRRSRRRLLIGAALFLAAVPHHAAGQDAAGRASGPKDQVTRELRDRIALAVDAGAKYLRESQSKDGSWSFGTDLEGKRPLPGSASHRGAFEGELARVSRAAEALLDAGVPAPDPCITSALGAVESGIGLLERGAPPLFLYTEYAAAVLRIRLRAGRVDDRSRRLCALLEGSVAGDGLVSAAVPYSVGKEPSRRADANGNPYSCFDAMSALDLARRCGIPTNGEFREKLGSVLARTQRADGGWNQFPAADGAAPGTAASREAPWMRSDFGGTSSALAAYVLARSAERTPNELASDPVVRKGLSWIAGNFSPWGGSISSTGKTYYSTRSYVNFLALVAIGDRLGGTVWSEKFHWYEEGAAELLKAQSRGGSWRHPASDGRAGIFHQRLEDNTACAVIFLAAGLRAREGTATGGGDRSVPTPEDFAALDWDGMGRLSKSDRDSAFEAAFRLFAGLEGGAREAAAPRFASFGPEVIGRLVPRLADEDPRMRSAALAALEVLVGETLEFDPDAPPETRDRGVRAWRHWLVLFEDDLVREGDRFVVRVGVRKEEGGGGK